MNANALVATTATSAAESRIRIAFIEGLPPCDPLQGRSLCSARRDERPARLAGCAHAVGGGPPAACVELPDQVLALRSLPASDVPCLPATERRDPRLRPPT